MSYDSYAASRPSKPTRSISFSLASTTSPIGDDHDDSACSKSLLANCNLLFGDDFNGDSSTSTHSLNVPKDDLIKEIQSAFLERYLLKNKIGRKTKLTGSPKAFNTIRERSTLSETSTIFENIDDSETLGLNDLSKVMLTDANGPQQQSQQFHYQPNQPNQYQHATQNQHQQCELYGSSVPNISVDCQHQPTTTYSYSSSCYSCESSNSSCSFKDHSLASPSEPSFVNNIDDHQLLDIDSKFVFDFELNNEDQSKLQSDISLPLFCSEDVFEAITSFDQPSTFNNLASDSYGHY